MPPVEPQLNVPESITGMELLEKFRSSTAHMAFVIDEYGVVQGIVTLHDLIEAITGELQGLVTLQDVFEAVIGEFRPRRAEDAWAVQREDGSWLLDGLIPIPELTDRLGLSEEADDERAGYQTLSGLVMWVLGRVPQTGDIVTWQGWRLEVVDMDGKRIDKILASRITPLRGAAPTAPN
jgi:putative hemolysin